MPYHHQLALKILAQALHKYGDVALRELADDFYMLEHPDASGIDFFSLGLVLGAIIELERKLVPDSLTFLFPL